jgi:hypothetical protein
LLSVHISCKQVDLLIGDPDHRVHELWFPKEVPAENKEEQSEDSAPVLEALVHPGTER